jgi:nitrogen regulatory protein P-II 1
VKDVPLADSQRSGTGVLETNMKRVEAIIRHHRLEDVKDALAASGVLGMTVSEVRGFGRQRGRKETYRGAEYSVDFVPKVHVEVIVPERIVPEVVDTIVKAARTGNVGDGKIFVSDLAEVIRIRTGESGVEAL